jgi:hypothetical protein
LGFTRSKFTFCNNCTNHSFSSERLDRAVENLNWCENFKDVDVRMDKQVLSLMDEQVHRLANEALSLVDEQVHRGRLSLYCCNL